MVSRSINSLLMLVYMPQYMALLMIVAIMGLVAGFMTVALYWEVTVILSAIFDIHISIFILNILILWHWCSEHVLCQHHAIRYNTVNS